MDARSDCWDTRAHLTLIRGDSATSSFVVTRGGCATGYTQLTMSAVGVPAMAEPDEASVAG